MMNEKVEVSAHVYPKDPERRDGEEEEKKKETKEFVEEEKRRKWRRAEGVPLGRM